MGDGLRNFTKLAVYLLCKMLLIAE